MTLSKIHDGNKHLHHLRQTLDINRPAEEQPKPETVKLPEANPLPPMSQAEIVDRFGVTTLDTLTTGHMQPQQAQRFRRVVQRVREWRQSERSFLLCSETKGIGKTHIARAAFDSFGVIYRDADTEWAHFQRTGRFLTARELMVLLSGSGNEDGGDTAQEVIQRSCPILVLDDVGREGNLKYISADNQNAEVQSRYYDVINFCYTSGIRVFVTSNYTIQQMASGRGPFNDATWSRLLEMCGKGHIIEMKGYPDYRRILGGF